MAKKVSGRGKRGSVNKAQAIRDEFSSQGMETRPKDIIASLKSKGIDVSSAQVSNIKATFGRPRRGHGANGALSVELLMEAKKLADRLGGIDVTRRAIEALSKLS
ncbi:MAG TPA: hypothetical protein VHD36_24650 [Pirellulales bacterium]|nr:hypothetical protein [Pirellulales bacterium]